MYKQNYKLIFFICVFLLTGCNGFFDKDNTPPPSQLTTFQPQVTPKLLWSVNTGVVSDSGLKMSPATSKTSIFTTSRKGVVTSLNKFNGHVNWRFYTDIPINTGPGVGDGIVAVGGAKGDVIALRQSDGRALWQRNVLGSLIANPAVGNGLVIVKAMNGSVEALATNDGHTVWSYQEMEPSLLLHESSNPIISDRNIFIGFATGELIKFRLDGQVIWQRPITIPRGAFAIERMIDIDADPLVYDHNVFAATFQGKIASVDWGSGRTLWEHDISSYTGMVADENNVYISDAKGYVWSFSAYQGLVNWRQVNLIARVLSAPALQGRYIVVGDAEGFVHWLDKQDGHFAARIKVGAPVYSTPIVENNVLYVLTNSGTLFAYTLAP